MSRELQELKANPPVEQEKDVPVTKPSLPSAENLLSSLSIRKRKSSKKVERDCDDFKLLSDSEEGRKSPSEELKLLSNLPNSATGSCSSLTSAVSSTSATLSLARKNVTSASMKIRLEYEEKINHFESEIKRYRTYARLLESELVRLHHYHQQQQQQQLLAFRQVGLSSPAPQQMFQYQRTGPLTKSNEESASSGELTLLNKSRRNLRQSWQQYHKLRPSKQVNLSPSEEGEKATEAAEKVVAAVISIDGTKSTIYELL
ncbi:hypothetical protein Ciccas_002420 [Cichlidogyrus casuarinus]|uniref:Uncharacterized protein n=1 Tax=Cichlidogyrus casuarinus TaxID=1844966 RepID=A0ABD2QKG1_9PLAT